MDADSLCKNCGGDEFVHDEKNSEYVCVQCHVVAAQNCLSSTVEFAEGAGGAVSIVGQHMAANATRPFQAGRPGQRRYMSNQSSDTKQATKVRGKRDINRLVGLLGQHVTIGDTAARMFDNAVDKDYLQGRQGNMVAAACVYMACRTDKPPKAVMMMDISDQLGYDVNALATCFTHLKDCWEMGEIVLPTLDPLLFINKYARQLNLGDKLGAVVATASRVASVMDRDWMTVGRKPTGICCMALVVATRAEGCEKTIEQVQRVVPVSEQTVKKRMKEFGHTPSANQGLVDFTVNIGIEAPKHEKLRGTEAFTTYSLGMTKGGRVDPPAFINSRLNDGTIHMPTVRARHLLAAGETPPPELLENGEQGAPAGGGASGAIVPVAGQHQLVPVYNTSLTQQLPQHRVSYIMDIVKSAPRRKSKRARENQDRLQNGLEDIQRWVTTVLRPMMAASKLPRLTNADGNAPSGKENQPNGQDEEGDVNMEDAPADNRIKVQVGHDRARRVWVRGVRMELGRDREEEEDVDKPQEEEYDENGELIEKGAGTEGGDGEGALQPKVDKKFLYMAEDVPIDPREIDSYILSPEEAKAKLEWFEKHHKDWILTQRAREEADAEALANGVTTKPARKKRRGKQDADHIKQWGKLETTKSAKWNYSILDGLKSDNDKDPSSQVANPFDADSMALAGSQPKPKQSVVEEVWENDDDDVPPIKPLGNSGKGNGKQDANHSSAVPALDVHANVPPHGEAAPMDEVEEFEDEDGEEEDWDEDAEAPAYGDDDELYPQEVDL